MKDLKCIIIEDDKMQSDLLEGFLEEIGSINILGKYQDGLDAIRNKTNWESTHIAFIDVEMPKISGLELIEKLPKNISVVLVTSKKEYAVEAFEKKVYNYILKPIQLSKLVDIIDSYREEYLSSDDVSNVDSIFLKCHSTYERIDFNDISVIKGADDYVEILTNHKKYLSLSTISNILKKLPSRNFMRVHRSSIINTDKITRLDGNIVMIDNSPIIVSKTYINQLIEKLNVL